MNFILFLYAPVIGHLYSRLTQTSSRWLPQLIDSKHTHTPIIQLTLQISDLTRFVQRCMKYFANRVKCYLSLFMFIVSFIGSAQMMLLSLDTPTHTCPLSLFSSGVLPLKALLEYCICKFIFMRSQRFQTQLPSNFSSVQLKPTDLQLFVCF